MTADAENSHAAPGIGADIPSASSQGAVQPGEFQSVSVEECGEILGRISHFQILSPADLEAIASLMRAHDYQAGATLFYEDDDSDAVFFIASGAIEVFKSNQSGKKMPLVVLRDGGLLGEIGLLSGERRTATARALNPARVLELPLDAFQSALDGGNISVYKLSLGISRVLAARLSTTDEKLFELFQNDVSDLLYKQLSELQSRLLTRWTG